MKNKHVFTAKDKDGNELELAVVRSSPKQQVEAQLEYSRAWRDAERSGSILRRDIDEIARKRGLWDDDKQKQVEDLAKEIVALEKKLRGGANSFDTLDEAKDCAFKIRQLRSRRVELLMPRIDLDNVTCESFADMARRNYLVSATTVYNDSRKPYFKDLDDFISQSNGDLALSAAVAYYKLNNEEDQSKNYEDEFLVKYKFTDEQGRLINKDGHLITDDGRLIDADGRFVDDQGRFINVNGDLVDESGTVIVEFKEWSVPVPEMLTELRHHEG